METEGLKIQFFKQAQQARVVQQGLEMPVI